MRSISSRLMSRDMNRPHIEGMRRPDRSIASGHRLGMQRVPGSESCSNTSGREYIALLNWYGYQVFDISDLSVAMTPDSPRSRNVRIFDVVALARPSRRAEARRGAYRSDAREQQLPRVVLSAPSIGSKGWCLAGRHPHVHGLQRNHQRARDRRRRAGDWRPSRPVGHCHGGPSK